MEIHKELPLAMVRLGRDIEDRTVVSTTPLTSVIAGKFTGRADKKTVLQTGRFHVRG